MFHISFIDGFATQTGHIKYTHTKHWIKDASGGQDEVPRCYFLSARHFSFPFDSFWWHIFCLSFSVYFCDCDPRTFRWLRLLIVASISPTPQRPKMDGKLWTITAKQRSWSRAKKCYLTFSFRCKTRTSSYTAASISNIFWSQSHSQNGLAIRLSMDTILPFVVDI